MKERLFCNGNLSDFLAIRQGEMLSEIERLSEEELRSNSDTEITDHFIEKYHLGVVEIDEENIEARSSDTKIDVRHRFDFVVSDRSKAAYADGTNFSFFVPYKGEKALLTLRPSKFTPNPPVGVASDREIEMSFPVTYNDRDKVKSSMESNLESIRKFVDWLNSDIDSFNLNLSSLAINEIEKRRSKLLDDSEVLKQLGFAIRRRSDAQKTYEKPLIQRKTQSRLRKIPERNEPTLDMEEYENIIGIVKNMVFVMECSPSAFATMNEENLRQHFLVQLNGQYESQATGETFNFNGKTDILIREQGKNIFIAECKFWSGPRGLHKAINQLLDYTSWRDTKTAILIFNRRKNLSNVLRKIPDVIKNHPNYIRDFKIISETEFRSVLSHKNDVTRELILTVLVFDVPYEV